MSAPIVVGYDGGACAQAALAEAARLAGPLAGEVVLAYGVRVQPAGGEVADLAVALRERAQQVLAEGVDRALAAGVTARAQIVEGRIADGLADLAQAEGAQLIVVGSYGESPVRGALLGSTPHRLLQLSSTPVLVVRA